MKFSATRSLISVLFETFSVIAELNGGITLTFFILSNHSLMFFNGSTNVFVVSRIVESFCITSNFNSCSIKGIFLDKSQIAKVIGNLPLHCEKLLELRFLVGSSWVLKPEFSDETATMNVVEYGYTAMINGQTKDIAQQWLDVYSSYKWTKEVE